MPVDTGSAPSRSLELDAVSARRTRTRMRLMTAAISVFAERGVIGSTVEEITERAGFSRGAFYSNFADKDELVTALLRHEIDTQYSAAQRALAALKEAAARPGQTAEALVSLALAAFDEAGRTGRDWTLTQQELLLYSARVPRVREAYLAYSAECLRQFSALIADAIAHAGRQFTVSFPDAVSLLTATHQQVQLDALLTGDAVDSRVLGVLLLSITRPLD